MENYRLFLDDIRYPDNCVHTNWTEVYEEGDWKIARDFPEFVNMIITRGVPSHISFDHDLAHWHYSELDNGINYNNSLFNEHLNKTGYHCAKWLVDFLDKNKLPLPIYYVHSMNPVGKANIISLLKSYEKHYESQTT